VKKLSVILTILLALCFASLAQAQATRTWVSGVGDDVNPCSRTAPCKTYAGAISKTAVNGIISTLDPGGFGAVTITKAIMIDGTGQIAGVLAAGSSGIIVNAPATDVVTLRNLEIHGAAFSGINGIQINQAKAVFIEGCYIRNFSQNGVRVLNTSNAVPVHIRNCDIRNNNVAGVLANPTATGSVGLDISESSLSNNGSSGVDLGANSAVTLTRCIVANNPNGVTVEATNSSGAIESCTIVGNGNGVLVGTGGGTPTVRIARSFISGNTTAGIAGTGTSRCFGNNTVDGNPGGNACTQPNSAQQ
jgi:hypothetical protein